jgi:hypothetical protein
VAGRRGELLATDLLSAGCEICYLEHLVVHHAALTARDPIRRRTAFLAVSVPRDRTSALA